jgi:hypothetical protein
MGTLRTANALKSKLARIPRWLCLVWPTTSKSLTAARTGVNVFSRRIPLKKSGLKELRGRGTVVVATLVSAAPAQVAAIGAGIRMSIAILRRFWAAAARWNSSRAPHGPRNRSRSSFKMRFKCANNISTFLRSRLEVT